MTSLATAKGYVHYHLNMTLLWHIFFNGAIFMKILIIRSNLVPDLYTLVDKRWSEMVSENSSIQMSVSHFFTLSCQLHFQHGQTIQIIFILLIH